MLFNSFTFLIFITVFFALWPLTRRSRNLRWLYIVVASFVFYGWWDWRFIFLIVASGLLDFICALLMESRPRRKRLFLVISIAGNLGSLAAFKYSSFIAENLSHLFSACGINVNLNSEIPAFMLILPVGISFYTFQSMSYTIDVYRGEIKPTRNILHFFSYLSMFPQLVAGPIVRAKHMLPQLLENRKSSEEDRWTGLNYIVTGYFQKTVIADSLAGIVDGAFRSTAHSGASFYWWLIITAFAFQIYCDFAGYSNIAIGLARCMGYRFEANFNHPYVSSSFHEFWQRWHISLSSWFRDYLFIPLGGSRKGTLKYYRNMWTTMLLSGLWHGASWNFVIWGALHAFFLSIEKLTKWPQIISKIKPGKIFAVLLILFQVWIGWVFFRAESLKQAVLVLKDMFFWDVLSNPGLFLGNLQALQGLFSGWSVFLYRGLLVMLTAVALEIFYLINRRKSPEEIYSRRKSFASMIFVALMIVICFYFFQINNYNEQQFIYFQF